MGNMMRGNDGDYKHNDVVCDDDSDDGCSGAMMMKMSSYAGS